MRTLNIFSTIVNSLTDVFKNQTVSMVQLTALFLVAGFLLYDAFKYKNNTLSQQVKAHLRKGPKKKRTIKFSFSLDELYDRFAHRLTNLESKVELKLTQANLDFTPKEYSILLLVGAISGALIGLAFLPFSGFFKGMAFFVSNGLAKVFVARIFAMIALGFTGSFFPKYWVYRLISKRTKELDAQLQDALMGIADGLQSGLTLNQAMKTVGDEMPEPMGAEFKIAYNEMQMGKTFNEALENLKNRVNIPDFNMAVNAMQIQSEAGGKLEDLLRGMVRILQERFDTRQEIKKTIANQKMVGIILLCAPFFFLFAFSAANEGTYTVMFSSVLGWVLIVVGIVCYAIAAWLIVEIIRYINKGV